jgi:hypothetical protein
MKAMRDIAAVFRAPSADSMAVQELEEARRALLAAQTALEWASANVTYNQDRVARLSCIVKEMK